MKAMVMPFFIGSQKVDERWIFQKPTVVMLPIRKEVTKNVNNYRDLEHKSKRK